MKKLDKSYIQYFLRFALPAIIFFAAMLVVSFNNYQTQTTQIRNSVDSSLKYSADISEKTVNSILHTTRYIDYNPNYTSTYRTYEQNSDDLSRLCTTLDSFAAGNDFIDSIFLVGNNSGKVVAYDGMHNTEDFFGKTYVYDEYSASYWRHYRFLDSTKDRVLAPTVANINGTRKCITPIIMRSIKNIENNCYLIVNVDIKALFDFDKSYNYTPNTQIYILNRYNGQIFHANGNEFATDDISDEPLYKQLIAGKNTFYYNMLGEGKCLIAVCGSADTVIGYNYFAAVPTKDIFNMQLASIIFTAIIALLCVLLSMYFAARNTARTISPYNAIISLFGGSGHDEQRGDVAEIAKNFAQKIHSQNERLTSALPFAQEKFLINYINSVEHMIDKDSQKNLLDSLPFKHEYFAVASVQLYPTGKLFETYSFDDWHNFQVMIHEIIAELFGEKFDAFVLSYDSATFYIVLNMDENRTDDDISEVMDRIKILLQSDAGFINTYLGKSMIHKGIESLKGAKDEIRHSLELISVPDDEKMRTNLKNEINFVFSDRDEDELHNALIALKTDEALELIKTHVANNVNKGIGDRSLKQFYAQIVQIILTAMKSRGISPDDGQMYFETYTNILTYTPDEIYKEILKLMDTMSRFADASAKRSNAQSIIGYIDANAEKANLSLDEVASVFGISTSYVSGLIKTNLGIGFHEYVTGKRIAKAKNLLKETDMPIDELFVRCGFSSKQTFFRVFKNNTGMSPGEYRKQRK